MFNMILALLVEKEIVTQKEGELLSKEVGNAMLPSDFRATQRVLKKITQKIK